VQGRFLAPRGALLALLLAVCAVVVGACQESGFDESKETERPLKVQHVMGETKVPGQAKEPLTLTLDTLDDTLALGVRPARAAVPKAKLPAYLRGPGGSVSLMRPVTASDLAAVEAVHPDLILGAAGTDGHSGQGYLYDRLSRIAPTVMVALGGEQWKLNVRQVGEGLGRTNDAEQLLIDYDHQAAQARKAIKREWAVRRGGAASGGGEAGGSGEGGGVGGSAGAKPRVAVALVTADGVRFAKSGSFAATILRDAGVRLAHASASADLTLVARTAGAKAHVAGRVADVDAALWWGPGGSIAAKTALGELRQALGR
jgi:ABC-type Fe3+-hydroxamate transport system substrate-binding protein